MANPTICSRHDDIIKLAKEIESHQYERFRNTDDAEALLTDIENLLWNIGHMAAEIISETKLAKESGQNMEDRLCEYKSAIEDLGFKRIKDS